MSERIQKYLARAGYGSRREIEQWLAKGRIGSRNGVYKLGDKVKPGDAITVDGKDIAVIAQTAPIRVIAYHKKEGEVSTRNDPHNRPTILDALPAISDGRWMSVGRLDINSTGLMLFSNNGELVHGLMHPSREVEREYVCRVLGKVTENTLSRLREGVWSKQELLCFDSIERMNGKGVNQWFRVKLKRGRNREIRRAWETLGCRVNRLKRIRYGPIRLSADLKQGRWVELSQQQVNRLAELSKKANGKN